MSTDHHRPDTCSNCGHIFNSERNFCPVCGQDNHDIRVPFKHLFHEFIEGTLHLDTKILTSLKLLLFAPGSLTASFLQGKRVTFVPPVRLYIFISFLFFLVLSFTSAHQSGGHEKKGSHHQLPGFIKLDNGAAEMFENKSIEQIDSIMASNNKNASALSRFMVHQGARLYVEGSEGFYHMLIKSLSYGMFFLMPFFALLVYLFHRKSFYIDNLIFSIHFHCFLFVVMALYFIINQFYANTILLTVVLLMGIIYLFFGLKKTFPDIRLPFIKTLFISAIYVVTIFITILSVVVISFAVF